MRWSIVRLIWFRELRDQLRDRRTIFMIAILPVLLYPLIGTGMLQLALATLSKPSRIGILGVEALPTAPAGSAVRPPAAGVAAPWLAILPAAPGMPLGNVPAVASAAVASRQVELPPILVRDKDTLRVRARYLDNPNDAGAYLIESLPAPSSRSSAPLAAHNVAAWVGADNARKLKEQQIDVILAVPPGFQTEIERGGKPTAFILVRERDDHSRLVRDRLAGLLQRWKDDVKTVRMARLGLPGDYDNAFTIWDSQAAVPGARRVSDDLFKIMTQMFPFVLVMWSLAGALYPAVDLCAGEKERGTMETLLISPASREEIVWGKFLTIWVFSAATALLNLVSMGLTTWQLSNKVLVHNPFRLGPLCWGVLLLLPLSAFFSAMCLSVGVYARSSKEGQYYLMPLFLGILPLTFLTLAPGVELNPFYSMVPVTGVALLLQSLMAAGTPGTAHLLYFVPVLAPMVIYSWLALRWAIEQFQREEVLFREAERLDVGLWIKALFRDKEALPSTGQALFCFGLILALRWLGLNIGGQLPTLVRTGISQLAFVAAPVLFMVVLLTTRPSQGLGLCWPPWWAWPAAALLGVLMVPPIFELTLYVFAQFPALKARLEQYQPLAEELLRTFLGKDPGPGDYLRCLLVFGLLPAVCEELAFRGFILTGLSRHYRPWTAILLSSFLWALYHMNVFQFAPTFIFGALLGFLVMRTGSVLPAMLFHVVYNVTILLPTVFSIRLEPLAGPATDAPGLIVYRNVLVIGCSALALGLLCAVGYVSRWRSAGPLLEPPS